jgi:hypothetical protein
MDGSDASLGIDAANGFPENGDRFTGLDLDAGLAHELLEVEVGFEAEAVAERGIKFFHEAEEWVFALEMIQEHEVAAGFADAFHFFHYGHGIGNCGNKICGENAVETRIGKFEPGGIHLHKADVAEAKLFGAFAGLVEHALGEVDAGEFNVAREEGKGETGANAYFEQFCAREKVQEFGPEFAAALKDLPEEDIVHTRIGVIHPLHIFHAHTISLPL